MSDDFAYVAGTNLNGQGGWSAHSSAGFNAATIQTPGLSHAGYLVSNLGSKVSLATSGEDNNHGFAAQTTGTVYAAVMVNLATASTTGDYFFHFFDGAIVSNQFRARLFAKRDGSNNVAFGVQSAANAGSLVYTPFSYALGTTYLIVIRYTFVPGATNDEAAIFVNPVLSPTEPAPSASTITTTGEADAGNLDGVAIRQGSAGSAASGSLDGIRVVTNWAALSWNIVSSAGTGGTIAPLGAVRYGDGDTPTYTITPDPGFHVQDVLVDLASVGAVTSYPFAPVQADHTIDASFALNSYTLTYTAGPNGSIGGTSPQVVLHGADGAQVTAVADANHHFVDWSDGVLTAARTDLGVTGDITVTANFAPTTVTLTYTAGPNGSISGTSPQVVAFGGGGATVTAVPDAGHHFVSWSDGVLTAARTDLGVTADLSVTASFAINTYTLTYAAGPNGSIVGTTPQVVNHGADGTTVTAVPDVGHHFVSWSDGVLTAARTDLGVTADLSVTASFAINTYTLTYAAGANGSIVGTTPQVVNHGADGTTVTAVPDAGHHFVSWSDGVLTAARTDLGVTADLSVTASFAINTYTLAYAAGANGSIGGITPQVVNHGADGSTVTAVPDAGYHFTSWSDGVLTAARTDLGVTANLSVTASFAINSYTLTYTAGPNGSISGTSPQVVGHGGNGTLVTAVADAGHHFVSWSDGVLTAARTDLGVTADLSVTASFAINTYTLAYAAGPNGSISGTTPQVVNHGANGSTVTAVPDPGYHFLSWSDAVLTAARTELGVTADLSVTASFAENRVVISQVYGGGGNTGATWKNDFIELFNRGADPVDLTGWTVQYGSSGGTTWAATTLAGVIQPGGYYLVQEAAGTGGSLNLPTPDAIGGITMSATAGKVALVNNATVLSGACPTGAAIEDVVGYGGANCSEGSPTGGLTNTTAALRNRGGCDDTDNNAVDLAVGVPNPRNSASPANSCLLTLTVVVDPAGGGTVAKSPDPPGYTLGSPVQLTATPNAGYHFDRWSGDASGSTNPIIVTMNTSLSVTAHFISNQPAGQIVISQVYGGGGNAGATYKNDFVELFNRGNATVNVTGWTVQYASASGGTWTATTLVGSIPPGRYYLVQEAQGSGGTLDLPAPDAIGSISMAASDGKVALASSGVLLSGTCPGGATLVDLVGYGSANCSETSAAPGLGNAIASFRGGGGCNETNNNAADFSSGAPAPRNSATPANICSMWLAADLPAETAFALSPVVPNPMHGPSRISFSMPSSARVRLSVLDLQGRAVATLVDGVLPAGRHEARWDGSGAAGPVRPGLYFFRVEVLGARLVRSVVLVR